MHWSLYHPCLLLFTCTIQRRHLASFPSLLHWTLRSNHPSAFFLYNSCLAPLLPIWIDLEELAKLFVIARKSIIYLIVMKSMPRMNFLAAILKASKQNTPKDATDLVASTLIAMHVLLCRPWAVICLWIAKQSCISDKKTSDNNSSKDFLSVLVETGCVARLWLILLH